MLGIVIEVNDQELELNFNLLKVGEQNQWKGSIEEEDLVLIPENEGSFDISTIYVNPVVKTSLSIIYERFLNSYTQYQEQLSVGLEPANEDDSKSDLVPYNPDEIKVRREGFSIFEINRMIVEQRDVDLNPEFQRNLVWDNARKSSLIESILLGIPIPVFYFSESKSGVYHVVDGLQRLSTVVQYLNNDFSLKKLEHLKECEGMYYKEDINKPKTIKKSLERKYTRRLENAQLIVNIIEAASPQKVKYDIFKRLNTGGRPLNQQEVRNCIAEQKVRGYLKELATSNEFLQATGESVSDIRMDAQELVLRFTGFKLEREGAISYSGDMNSFLDDVLDEINGFNILKIESYKKEFLKSMRINYHLFGRYCFRKILSEHLKDGARKQNINKALFVTWSVEVLSLNEDKIKKLVPFEAFAYDLAKALDKKGKYYTILTTGTSDKQNLKDAADFTRKLLKENITV